MYEDTTEVVVNEIKTVLNELSGLTTGYIVKKNIKGNDYYYRRVKSGDGYKETYIDKESLEDVRGQIEKRKTLEKRLKELEKKLPYDKKTSSDDGYMTNVVFGDDLYALTKTYKAMKRRKHVGAVYEFLHGDTQGKVLLLCGLKGSGNTTMMYETIAGMDDELGKAAYIRIDSDDDFVKLNHDMKKLRRLGCSSVFVDEVTQMEDFISGAAVFAELFAGYGLKIVLTGTDSLGIRMTEKGELWHRHVSMHTTHVSYAESEEILGIKDIDEYVRLGGTMSPEKSRTAADGEAVREYIYRAVAQNIEVSLANARYGGRFLYLEDLYDEGRLQDAVYAVVENMNRNFAAEIIDREARSCTDVRQKDSLLRMRDVLASRGNAMTVDEDCVAEIEEYLDMADFVYGAKRVPHTEANPEDPEYVTTQPWIRYGQVTEMFADAIRHCDLADTPVAEKHRIYERLSKALRERLAADTVLLETMLARSDKDVYRFTPEDGEDAVLVTDEKSETCEIFRIACGTSQKKEPLDEETRRKTEALYGKITSETVITLEKDGRSEREGHTAVATYLERLWQ